MLVVTTALALAIANSPLGEYLKLIDKDPVLKAFATRTN